MSSVTIANSCYIVSFAMRFSATVEVNKCSKKFDKRPHRRCTRSAVHILYAGPPFSTKLLLLLGIRTPSFLGHITQIINPNGISIGSAVFAGLTIVTDRRTDKQTALLCL